MIMNRYNNFELIIANKIAMEIKGTVKYNPVGIGTWTIVSDAGTTYELYQPPQELKESDLRVNIEGKIRKDIMTIAMVGDVVEIISFQKL